MSLSLGVILAAAAFGGDNTIGAKPGDFALQTTDGAEVKYAQLSGRVNVVMFIATGCPVSNAYNERMSALHREYAPRGVNFIFINSNATEPAAVVADHARKNGFPFTVYKDAGNAAADLFQAQYTPESFVLDQSGVVRYHGHIDDAQNETRITRRGLRMALDALLSGKSVDPAETKAFGCTIKRKKS